MNEVEMEVARKKRLTHAEKLALAVSNMEKAQKRLNQVKARRLNEIARIADRFQILDADNSVFEAAFKKINDEMAKPEFLEGTDENKLGKVKAPSIGNVPPEKNPMLRE